jgi:glutathionylspermidine synthase
VRRQTILPRSNWQSSVEELGLLWHSDDNGTYWDESAFYAFGPAEIETIEAATEEVYSLYRQAGERIANDERWLSVCGIPASYHNAVRDAWQRQGVALDYGRFDFGYGGQGPPKLFEFNCDTPTTMLETSVIQWYWKEELFPDHDQLNSLHERLVERWGELAAEIDDNRIWFAHSGDLAHEDTLTTTYMRDIAGEAGLETRGLLIDQIGIDGQGRIVDQDDNLITALFKLYPWEWLAVEPFGEAILPNMASTAWIEPVWKMMWSNKAVLALLWEMFPGHPNLLPASLQAHEMGRDYVTKPILAREGANVEIVIGGQLRARSEGNYGRNRLLHQQLYPLRDFGHGYPVLGSWIVNGSAAGLGIREDGLITGNRARFVPHIIEE